MLKHNSDLRSIVFSMLCMLIYIIQWNVQLKLYIRVVFFTITSLQAFQQTVIIHNCAHCHPFTSRINNEIYFILLSALSATPVSLYVPGHNMSHHKHLESEKDVMRTSKMKYKSECLNLLLFMPTILIDIQRNDLHYMMIQYRCGNSIFWRFVREIIIVHICIVGTLYMDYKKAILIYVGPTIIGKYMIITLNMLQHYGCDPNSKFNHSRNFTGNMLNYFYFNNGYHTVHHNNPGLHWSKTKARHDEIKDCIRPDLNQECMLRYLFYAHVIR